MTSSGDEESYGFLVNKDVRDKDAVSAATMTAEMALYHKSQGRSLWDQLRRIWEKYGYFQETLISRVFKGEAGLRTMNSMMEKSAAIPLDLCRSESYCHERLPGRDQFLSR